MRFLKQFPVLALLVPSLLAQTSGKENVGAESPKAQAAQGQDGSDPQEKERRPFMRFVENKEGGFLQVKVADYQKGDCKLTLYGCVHVADRAFYVDMQERFTAHDALLYELIAEPDLRPYPGMPSDGDHWISMVQDGMGQGLALQAQFECMDYRMKNFVHADMTDEEWMEALDEVGKSELGELMAGGFAEPDREKEAKQKPIDLVKAFRSGQGISQLRIMMGRVLCSPDGMSDQPTVIIHGRNEKCLEVLGRQVKAGKKSLGIFYGAAHMEHMEQRLLEDLGWKRVKEQWVNAWDCRHSSFPKVERGLKQKRYRARRDLGKLVKAIDRWSEEHDGKLPTWQQLRAANKDGKLPGRADGKDPWGRDYVLVPIDGGYEVRSTASDGKLNTEDDVVDGGRTKERR